MKNCNVEGLKHESSLSSIKFRASPDKDKKKESRKGAILPFLFADFVVFHKNQWLWGEPFWNELTFGYSRALYLENLYPNSFVGRNRS